MPNPADSYERVIGNIHTVRNNKATGKLDDQLRLLFSHRLVDAYITDIDADYEARYTVDVYESGFGKPSTRQQIQALTCDPREVYAKWYPCKGIFFLDRFFIVSGLHMFFLKVSDSPDSHQKNRVKGWPAGFDGSSDGAITVDAQKIDLNFVHPHTMPFTGTTYDTTTKFAWLRYPEPYKITGDGTEDDPDYTAAGVIILGGGSLPPGGSRYQVLQRPDDTQQTAVWGPVRFTDDVP